MSATVRIREATAGDAEAIADVHAASIRELGREAYDDEQARAWLSNVHPERYPLEEPGFEIAVAERQGVGEGDDHNHACDGDSETAGDDIVGFGLLDTDPSGVDEPATGEIGAVYVHPDVARAGVGSAILEHLESAARDAGLEALTLTASRNAVDFYERRGYEALETVSLEMTEKVSLEAVQMRTSLT